MGDSLCGGWAFLRGRRSGPVMLWEPVGLIKNEFWGEWIQ